MRIEKNNLNTITYPADFQDANSVVREIGTYQIHCIQDWGLSLLIQLNALNDPIFNDLIKIYVDKEKFRAFFAEGDTVTRFRHTPAEGLQVKELGGVSCDNTHDFLVNTETLHKSEFFYPWDPYW